MMKSALLRGSAALIALIALPACRFYDEHSLLVVNNTANSIIVDVEVDDSHGHDDDVFVIPAGGLIKEEYHAIYDMDVIIIRQVDNFVLFAGGFDYDDFEDDHDTVEIIIGP